MTQPASTVLFAIPLVAACSASFIRIQEYLLLQSIDQTSTESSSVTRFSEDLVRDRARELPGEWMELQKMPASSARDTDHILTMTNVTVSSTTASPLALSKVTFSVIRGSMTVVIGPGGSRKLTLLYTILGEVPIISGTMKNAASTMSYCSQTPWTLKRSIRECICGPNIASDIEHRWYQTVLHACALEDDIKEMLDGDRTVIGSRGLTLSGGQKQRLLMTRNPAILEHDIDRNRH